MKTVLEKVLKKAKNPEGIKNYVLDTSDYNEDRIHPNIKKKYIAYDYINNGILLSELFKKYNIFSANAIDYYKELVRLYGYEVFDNPLTPEKSSFDKKLEMVKEVLEEGKSIRSVAIKHRMLNYSTLRLWVDNYKKKGDIGIKGEGIAKYKQVIEYTKAGKSRREILELTGVSSSRQIYILKLYKMYGISVFDEIQMKRTYTEKEKKEIIKYFAENGENIIKTSLHFKMISTATLYSWIFSDEVKKNIDIKGTKYHGTYKTDYNIAKEIESGNTNLEYLHKKYEVNIPKIRYIIDFVKMHGAEPFNPDNRNTCNKSTLEELVISEISKNPKKTSKEIALKLKIPNKHLVDICRKKTGIKKRNFLIENKKEILDFYKKCGKNQTKTAIHFGIPNSTLSAFLRGFYSYEERNETVIQKYKNELEIAKEIESGNTDEEALSNSYNILKYIVRYFIKYVKKHGSEDFEIENRLKRKFDKEEKAKILSEIDKTPKSMDDICIKYRILDKNKVYSWRFKERKN